MDQLRVSLVQYNISWAKPEDNFRKIEEIVKSLETSDLIVLPEMFNTGFCVKEPQHAESSNGPSMQFLKELSLKHNVGVASSLMMRTDTGIVNRFVLVDGEDVLCTYDKMHLFHLSGEGEHFVPGAKSVDCEFRGFKIRPIICYDLRFPYLSYNDSDYDLLLVVANWPAMRIGHWESLLEARAIENQAYVVGVNRVGIDPFGVEYPGHSEARGPSGELLLRFTGEHGRTVSLSKSDLNEFRTKLPFLQDRTV